MNNDRGLMSHWWIKTRVLFSLGLPNVFRVATYRLGIRLGLHPVQRMHGAVPEGPFFCATKKPLPEEQFPLAMVVDWRSNAKLFSRWPVALGDSPPDWMTNLQTGQRIPKPERPWWKIPDFDPAVGDIKLIWEMSRMDWVLAFAQRARLGDELALKQLNLWMADWCCRNPPYLGPNWKCGQEASIRVMHLACAIMVLGQTALETLPNLRELIILHLKRIEPTIRYAMAQDNNHGTSEAAALFIGGSWLAVMDAVQIDGQTDSRGTRWAAIGRDLLEKCAKRLIGENGTFSQYSLNYHRVMLDTFSITECWRRRLDLPLFSKLFQSRALAATRWLHTFVDPITGDGPNVGANDGARLLQLADTQYRDYRPSVQLAMALFAGQRAYASNGSFNDALHWLSVELPYATASEPQSLQADDGGFMVLRRGSTMALLRYPRFRFRPSQADALHLDFWINGQALLRDAGTFSYNTESKWLNYFGGVVGHNTIQFDGQEQMPRISRFLLGGWLRTLALVPITENDEHLSARASYRKKDGVQHQRDVFLAGGLLRVQDKVEGFKHSATLRWRLAPGSWILQIMPGKDVSEKEYRVANGQGHVLSVRANMHIVRCEIVQGWESLHYLEKTPTPVLEIEVAKFGTMTTEYSWST